MNFLNNYSGIIELTLLITGIIISATLFYVSIISIIEKEYRAFRVSFLMSTCILIPFLLIFLLDFPNKELVVSLVLVLILIGLLFLFFPFNPTLKGGFQIPKEKHDERDVMFSRNELESGTEPREQRLRQTIYLMCTLPEFQLS